jgi:mevalonate kinase
MSRAGREFSVPGKVFILGEYAVLAGLPALVAAVAPRFRFFQGQSPSSPKNSLDGGPRFNPSLKKAQISPRSPAGKLMNWAADQGWPSLELEFDDPYLGSGGFGGSTAEFITVYHCYSEWLSASSKDWAHWSSPWELYRKLTQDEPLPPSGADLVTQWEGGIVWIDPQARICRQLGRSLDGSHFLVFSATQQLGRKVPTHVHLSSLRDLGFAERSGGNQEMLDRFQRILFQVDSFFKKQDWQRQDWMAFGQAMNGWAEVLSSFGLEAPATRGDREALSQLPGVIGVKGAGAMQSDAVLVLVDPQIDEEQRKQIIQKAESRRLILVSDGIAFQEGVQCQRS